MRDFIQAMIEGKIEAAPSPARGTLSAIDCGETRVSIAEEVVRIHLFVATLGYSGRVFAHASQPVGAPYLK